MTAKEAGGERLCAEECWKMTQRALQGCEVTNPPGHLWRDKWTALSAPLSCPSLPLSLSLYRPLSLCPEAGPALSLCPEASGCAPRSAGR